MINLILASDTEDAVLGDFLANCSIETSNMLNGGYSYDVRELNGSNLNDLMLFLTANAFNSNPFLFISYTHGSRTELLRDAMYPILSTTLNKGCLKNSFAYCFACDAGIELGPTLIDDGTLCFIGYDNTVRVQKYFDAPKRLIECATEGLRAFMNGKDCGESFDDMISKYTSTIDEIYQTDTILASLFMHNRDALVIHGDEKLTINNFNTN